MFSDYLEQNSLSENLQLQSKNEVRGNLNPVSLIPQYFSLPHTELQNKHILMPVLVVPHQGITARSASLGDLLGTVQNTL